MVKKHKLPQKGAIPSPSQPLASVSHAPSPTPTQLHQQSRSVFQLVRNISVQRSFQLVALAAIYSPLSQLNLDPVYGSIPTARYHRYGLTVCVLLAFGLRGKLPKWVNRSVAAFCFWIPTIQFALFQLSSNLGPSAGPLLTEALTYYPLLILSMYVGTQLLEDVIGRDSSNPLTEVTPSMGLFVLFTIIQRSARSWLTDYIGRHLLLSRIGLQLIIAVLYSIVLPYGTFLPAVPSVAFTMIGNPHTPLMRTTNVCNNTLALSDFTLLDRTESTTGYLSVLESQSDPRFRVLRCDHSLLGGNWILPPRKPGTGPQRLVSEPIYAIFTMLEAVRLVDPPPALKPPATQLKALNIGLGIGTAPSALLHHNINTTILELDPAVHAYAVKYFDLPTNHSYYIGDAVSAVHASARNPSHRDMYHYIIHDVFTGGAEPVALFTTEFLGALSTLLKPDGAVAINYAADLSQPSTSLIYRTITSVFDNCKVYREEPPLTESSTTHSAKAGVDFTNMVFFCRRRSSTGAESALPLRFRKPVEADFLGSSARKEYLVPRWEVQPSDLVQEGPVLTEKNTKLLEKYQVQSAIGHWRIMRGVLPNAVWETW